MNEYEYLDLLKRKLDPSQKRVCCRTQNTIVAAGAGSGKTQVLATRFAWLVMSCGIPAAKILTLTFTKKAAAEMYSRIYQTLLFFSQKEEVPALERSRAKQAVADFSQVHIQTLDSYCSSVVRQVANRYGIRPDFSPSLTSEDLSLKAFQFVLKNRTNFAIEYFLKENLNLQNFAQTNFSDVVQRYTSIADDDDFFMKQFLLQRKQIVNGWNKNIKAISQCVKDFNLLISEAGDARSDDFFVALSDLINNRVPELFLIQDESELEQNKNLLQASQDILKWADEVSSLKTSKRKEPFAQAKQMLIEFSGDGTFKSLCAYIADYAYLKEHIRLLDEFAAECRRQNRLSGVVSVKDLVELSLKILVEQKDIRTQEKNAYSKIMIDEFQDNNSLNRDLLFLLSEQYDTFTEIKNDEPGAIQKALVNHLEKEKLFFVGDEKQSIYKFRGADVSVFNQLKTDLQTEPLQMIYNYRSNGALVSTFNMMFGGWREDESEVQERDSYIFEHEALQNFEAAYPKKAMAKKVNLTTYEELPGEKITSSTVNGHICFVNKSLITDKAVQLDYHNQEAFFTAKKIYELYTASNEQSRHWRDFAILDVSTTKRNYIINWLNRFGIPFSLDSQRDIFLEAPINDIYSFLRLCVFPSDTRAAACVLASPFANLSDGAVLDVLSVITAGKTQTAFLQSDEEKILQLLSKDDARKYKKAAEFFCTMRTKVLGQSLALSISQLWNEAGYRYEVILNKNANLLAEQFDLLFELARQTDEQGKNCAWFVEQLALAREGNSKMNIKDLAYPIEKGDAVQIMTIHKSKGLQFKHVFIFGLLKQQRDETNSRNYFSDAYGFCLCPRSSKNYFSIVESDLERQKERAEFSRLIYVAITRAETDFYVIGSWDVLKDNSKREIEIFEKSISSYYGEYRNLEDDEEGETVCDESDAVYKDGAPFDFYTIPAITKSQAYRQASNFFVDEQKLIANAKEIFETHNPLHFKEVVSNKRTPSSLETEGVKLNTSEALLFSEIDSLIKTSSLEDVSEMEMEDLSEEEFSRGSFGTLVHAWLEQFVKTGDVNKAELPVRLYKNLSDSEIKKADEICKKICEQFAQTDEGRAALQNADDFVKTEWAFYFYRDGLLYHGSMDLIFKNADGTYTIIDYKTDDSINTEKYIEQQRCYKEAAAELLDVEPDKIQCKLYFIRFNRFMQLDFTPAK